MDWDLLYSCLNAVIFSDDRWAIFQYDEHAVGKKHIALPLLLLGEQYCSKAAEDGRILSANGVVTSMVDMRQYITRQYSLEVGGGSDTMPIDHVMAKIGDKGRVSILFLEFI